MASLISTKNLSKTFGSKELFSSLSLSINDREKIAIIGRNGVGKSTLLKILSGQEEADSGDVIKQKHLKMAYIPQSPSYPKESTVEQVLIEATKGSREDEVTLEVQRAIALSLCGFEEPEKLVSELSGGWVKRLSIAEALCKDPLLLFLDEPTNHMDWEAIKWLEDFLKNWEHSFVLISHDRAFLNSTTNRTIEIGPAFVNEHLSYNVSYNEFLDRRALYFEEQEKLSQSLGNKARREVDWLRAGVKARTTKSTARIKDAHELLDNLDKVKTRLSESKRSITIKIDETGRKTKKLVEAEGLSKAYGDKLLFKDLDFVLSPKMRLALLGDNGSGKTTLIKMLMGDVKQDSGTLKVLDDLKIVYFDQAKADLDETISIFDFLGEGSKQVMLAGRPMHVASYATKFLFSQDHFFLKISQLSGGEKARLQLAKILLKPADILILDEPTNDLDIDSLVLLEETLSELSTCLILISHDRSFIQNICNKYLALEGEGDWNFYGDLDQWLSVKNKPKKKIQAAPVKSSLDEQIAQSDKKPKKKLSYKDKKEYESIEKEIQKKEAELEKLNEKISSPLNPQELIEVSKEISSLQDLLAGRYQRWEELEALMS